MSFWPSASRLKLFRHLLPQTLRPLGELGQTALKGAQLALDLAPQGIGGARL